MTHLRHLAPTSASTRLTGTLSRDEAPVCEPEQPTYDLRLLEHSLAKWRASPALRAVYGSIYREMAENAIPGPAIEIGSGCGTAREFIPGIVTTDVRKTPFVDHAASAYALEAVPAGPWATIYALDVLHHLREPIRFFANAAEALQSGGRVVICDPSASPWPRALYCLLHHEPIAPDRLRSPWSFPADNDSGAFANMGMAWALFVRDRKATDATLGSFGLRVRSVAFRDVIAYLLTGGFSRPPLAPSRVIKTLLAIEQRLSQSLLRILGMRMIVVLERLSSASPA